MTSKIFRSIILVAGSILAASFLLIFGIMYSYLTDELRGELKSEAGYVAQAVESGGIDYLERLPEEENRITLIENDGTVLYDSKVEISEMENHIERPEVQLAIENGYGEDTRYSDTLSDKTMYYAVRLSDGKILRVAQVQDTVLTLLLGLIHPVLYILALMFLLAAFLARKVAKKVTEPMNNLDL
ncbi:MAG: histidine kinase, partial [Clostridiales bacterium]|nr:histidine kinase [Clostridiales bacterium]